MTGVPTYDTGGHDGKIVESHTPAYLVALLLVVSIFLSLGTASVDLVEPIWLLVAVCMFPNWLWWTTSVLVTAERVEIVNTFRMISVPLAHVIRLEPDSGAILPCVLVTTYGKFEMARLANGRDPGTNDAEVAASISEAISRHPGVARGMAARWRRRRLRLLDWVVALSALVGALVQTWLIATG